MNFVRLVDNNTIEYRCFERGIDRETLACGTGALASAFVSHHLRGIDGHIINVLPHRCRWHDREARIQVSHDGSAWMLESTPILLFQGKYLAVRRALQQTGDNQSRRLQIEADVTNTGGMKRPVLRRTTADVSLQ